MDDSVYLRIAEHNDQNPMRTPTDEQGYSEAFIEYLKLLYNHEEAELVQHLRVYKEFRSVEEVAELSGKDAERVGEVLRSLHAQNKLLGIGDMFCLPPMPLFINIHHFYPEVKSHDLEAARLHKEFFIDDKFYKRYESSDAGTPVFRTIVVEKAIHPEHKRLEAEEARNFINEHAADDIVLVPCPCRTRTEKVGIRECKDRFPIACCIMLGLSAMHFEMLGLGKRVTKQQAIDYLEEMLQLGLVAQTDNAVSGNIIICMCCGCCCSQLRGRTRWDNPDAVAPSNFIPKASDDCVQCATCIDRCFFSALTMAEDADRPVVDPEKCIGCGVCAVGCEQEALRLHRFERSRPFEKAGTLIKTIAKENRGA